MKVCRMANLGIFQKSFVTSAKTIYTLTYQKFPAPRPLRKLSLGVRNISPSVPITIWGWQIILKLNLQFSKRLNATALAPGALGYCRVHWTFSSNLRESL